MRRILLLLVFSSQRRMGRTNFQLLLYLFRCQKYHESFQISLFFLLSLIVLTLSGRLCKDQLEGLLLGRTEFYLGPFSIKLRYRLWVESMMYMHHLFEYLLLLNCYYQS